MEFLLNALIFIICLICIWIGSGIIVNSVEKLAFKLHASSFIIAFFVLGVLTSMPEFAIAYNSLANKEPEVSVGNLLGGFIVLFLLVIPLLGFVGNGVKLNHDISNKNLVLSLLYILAPVLLLADNHISISEGIFLVLFYGVIIYFVSKQKSDMYDVGVKHHKIPDLESLGVLLSVAIGVMILISSSNYLVKETVFFGEKLGVSPFLISLVVLSLGTNLPELSLAIRSILNGKKNIAFGNYVGSAVVNSLILGVIAIANQGIEINRNFLSLSLFLFIGVAMFYIFARSRDEISRRESLILLIIYMLFVGGEVASSL